jgi:circadian clock protein KaiB
MDESRTVPPGGELGEEHLAPAGAPPRYFLRLYVTGKTPNSIRAVARIKEVCEEFLPGQYQLQVVDIYQQPALAEGDRILVAPTLVRRSPGPLRRLIGNLYDRDRLLAGLELQPVAGG